MKKLCIFDLDGTLTNTIPAIAHFGNTALASQGFAPIETEKYKKLVGDGRTVLIHRMLAYYDADTPEMFDKVCAEYDRCYEADPMYKTGPYDGIPELLNELKALGVKIAVCSNKPHNVVCSVVKTVFGDMFDIVKGIAGGDKTKPDPGCALKIMANEGCGRGECVFIGDTNVDIFTAKAAGIESIGVLWGFRDRRELEEAGAEHIAERPDEILRIVKEGEQ